MTVYTYWGNKDPQDGTSFINIASGDIPLGGNGDFTEDELASLADKHWLILGIVDPPNIQEGTLPAIGSGPSVAFRMPVASGEVAGTGAGSYCGFTVRETSGAAATVIIYDNASQASGPILDEITLLGGQSTSDNYPRPGRQVKNGIYVQITGAIEGSVFQ